MDPKRERNPDFEYAAASNKKKIQNIKIIKILKLLALKFKKKFKIFDGNCYKMADTWVEIDEKERKRC